MRLPFDADGDGMNDDRAEWAETAIEAFMKATRTEKEDALCDLLGDVAHWADRNGMDFAVELLRAKNHYEAETMNGGGRVTGKQFQRFTIA